MSNADHKYYGKVGTLLRILPAKPRKELNEQ